LVSFVAADLLFFALKGQVAKNYKRLAWYGWFIGNLKLAFPAIIFCKFFSNVFVCSIIFLHLRPFEKKRVVGGW